MKHIIKQFGQRDAHPLIQFIKYGIAGGIATAVDMTVFYTLSWKIFPALKPDDPFAQLFGLSIAGITESLRLRNYVINRTITFFFSNLTAYLVNIVWVFEPGRHKKWVEVTLFYAVSLTSYVIGTTLGGAVIKMFGMSTTFAYLVNIISALLINYACRKFLIFKK